MARAPRARIARKNTIVQFERSGCALDHTLGPDIPREPSFDVAAAISSVA